MGYREKRKGKKGRAHEGPSIEKNNWTHEGPNIYEKSEDSHVLKNISKGGEII
jgi:hypothetical protein